jgi:hypothetical protein
MSWRTVGIIWRTANAILFAASAMLFYYVVVPPVAVLFAAGAVYHAYRLLQIAKHGRDVFGKRRIPAFIAFRCGEIVSFVMLLFVLFGAGPRPHQYQSNESAAIGNLRTILGAENAYNSATGTFGNWADMTGVTPPYLDGDWTTMKSGYDFTLTTTDNGKGFEAVAVPHSPERGTRGFYVNEKGVIRFSKNGLKSKPNSQSMPIGDN